MICIVSINEIVMEQRFLKQASGVFIQVKVLAVLAIIQSDVSIKLQ